MFVYKTFLKAYISKLKSFFTSDVIFVAIQLNYYGTSATNPASTNIPACKSTP